MPGVVQRKIETRIGLKEFTIQFAGGTDGISYVGTVLDERGNEIRFRMRKDVSGMWVIASQQLPGWVFDAEMSINDIIEFEMNS